MQSDDRTFDKLALQAQTGDLAAAEALIRALHEPLFALLHLRGTPEKDIEDVAQSVNLAVYRSLSRYEPARTFLPWFRTIVRNMTADYWRTNIRDKDRFNEFREYVSEIEEDVNEAHDELEQRRSQLASCMEKLKEKQRSLLAMHYYERKDSFQIARQIGAKAAAVRKALERIRGALRVCMEQDPDNPLSA